MADTCKNQRFINWYNRLQRIEKSLANNKLPKFLQYPIPLIDNPLPRKNFRSKKAPYSESIGQRYRVMISGSSEYGLPYGCMARMLIAYSTTRMKMDECRIVKLATSQSKLMSLFGYISTSGGQKGIQYRLSNSINTLIRSVIQFEEFSCKKNGNSKIYNGPFEYIESYGSNLNSTISQNEVSITHSESYFNYCLDRGTVPVDTKTFLVFSDSTCCLDFYVFLVHKASSAPRIGLCYSWLELAKIFDNTSKKPNSNKIKTKFERYLPRIKWYWPDLQAAISESGLSISRSNPPIKRKAVDK